MNRQAKIITDKQKTVVELYNDKMHYQKVMLLKDVEDLLGEFGIEKPDYNIKKEVFAGDVIKHLRTKINWSQKDLAGKSGVQNSAISRMENVNFSIGMHSIMRMLVAMGFDLQDYTDAYNELKEMNT